MGERILDRCPGCRRVNVKHSAFGLCRRCYRQRNLEKELEGSRRWKREHREHVREYDHRYHHETKNHCPHCGDLKTSDRNQCAGCVRATIDARYSLIEGMWAEGWKQVEIADAIGTTKNSLNVTMFNMRKAGWDLPLRGPGGRILTAA